jgi:hypothetical protein
MPTRDPEKKRAQRKRWAERNPDKVREARKRWEQNNPDRAEKQRQYMAAWKERNGIVPKPRPASTAKDFPDRPDDPRHGTVNGYSNLKCRCDRCRAAWAIAYRARRARRK